MKRGDAIAKGARRCARVRARLAAAAAALLSATMPATAVAGEVTKLQSDPRAVPTIATLASPSVTLGAGQLADVAVITGRVAPQPDATVTFTLFGPDDVDCTRPPVFESAGVPYPVGGGAVLSAAFTPVLAGTYRWRASYSGDANNQPVVAPCNGANENVTVFAPSPLASSSALPLLAPFPIVRVRGRTEGSAVRITLITVRAATGTYLVTSCTGRSRGCPYRERITQILGAPGRVRTEHVRPFERVFRSGVVLRVYVVQEGRIGKFTSFKIKRRQAPIRTDRCVRGISLAPAPCPVG
ncbi:MAG TPA: hypothetical protein VNA28_02725 [Solirubrobacteraceae bacterium]|nr:hypothetical protein [Solirubrobacteraceae bacterium]